MKKRTLSLLMCLLLIVGVMPTTAFAAGGTTDTWAVKLNVSESDAYSYNGQKVLALGFGVQSDNLPVRKAASMVLAVDLEMFDLLKDNDDFSGVENAAGDLTVSLVQASTPIKKGVTIKPSESWNLNVYYAKSADEKFGYIQMIASQDAVDDKVVTAKDLATMYIGFKSGKSVSDLTKNSIRFINAAECALLNQGSAIEITNGKGNMQQAFLKDGSAGTLTITPEVAWNGITPSEPAKPAYTGAIAAPTVKTNAGGKVELNDAVLTPADSAAKIQYGYSKTNDGKNITWQDSTTFNLTVGSTYYFYAKVVGTTEYTEKVSAVSDAVKVADKALTNLEIVTAPTNKTYTHGDTFKADGMKVKAIFNDGSENDAFTGYTVAYETSGKNYLCKDNTKVTLKAGDKSVEVTGLSVSAKELTVTDLTAKNREYKPGDTSVTLTGGTLNGVVSGETVTLDTLPAATVADDKVEDNKAVTISSNLSLSGTDAGNYTLTQPTGIKVNITAKDIGSAVIALGAATTYTGTEQSVVIDSVKVDGTPLTNPTDYTITSGDKATDVGNTLLTIKGEGNYTGTASTTWSLQKATPNVGDFDLTPATPDPSGYNYGSFGGLSAPTTTKAGMGSVTVKYDGNATVPTNAGTYTVTFDVAESQNYNAVNLPIGTLKINQIDYAGTMNTTDTVRSGQETAGKTLTLPELPAGASYGTPASSDALITSGSMSIDSSTNTLTYSTTAQTAGTEATITIPVTGATNYNDYNVTVTITAQDKQTLTITGVVMDASSYTYGDTVGYNNSNLSVTGATDFNNDDLEYIYSGTPTDGSTFTTGETAPTKAGSYQLTVKVPDSNADYMGQQVINFTIEQKSISTMEVTLDKTELEYDGNSQSVTATVAGLTAGTDYTVTGNTQTNVGNYTVTVTGTGNYKDNATATWKITQATPDVGNVSYTGGTIHTSTALSAISLSMDGTAVGSGNLKLDAGQTLTVGTNNYNWTFTPSDTTNYKTVTGKVSLTVEEDALKSIAVKAGTAPTKVNYKYKEPFEISGAVIEATYASGATKDVTSEVEFSTTLAVDQAKVEVTYQGQKCEITGITVNKADARTLDDITVSQKHTVTTEQSKDIGKAGMPEDAGTLTYTAGTASSSGGSASVTASVTGSTVKFTITGGAVGEIITLPVTIGSDNYADSTVNVVITLTDKDIPTVTAKDITVTYDGNAIPNSKITGTATFGGTTVEGAWSFKTTAPKVVADSNPSVAVVFTPNDATTYAAVETNIKVTINKADPTGTPTYTAITTGGKKLSDAALAIGSITPAGGTIAWDLGDTTDVTANTAYGWTYTPTDTANYNPLKGSITPYVVSSSSGGGSYTPSYTVSVDKTENGTITVSPKSASKGSIVTITVKPDKGYELETLKALDKDGNALKLTEKNGKYTFTMPTGKVTVKGSFVEEAPVQIFKDVPTDAYYYEAVKWAAEKGITGGVGNDLFAPNQPCTRGQIVTFLWRAAGSPAPKNMSSFTDVPADAFYAKAVAWAVENGITGGTGDGKFSPDATCTRAQAVTFLYRASGAPAVSGNAAFSDVATNAYYAAAVKWAEKNGITGGIGGGLFGSDNNCTRAQIVTFLYRNYQSK